MEGIRPDNTLKISHMEGTIYRCVDSVEDSEDLRRLFTELTGIDTVPDVGRINRLVAGGGLAFYAAFCGERMVGMVSVLPCRTAATDKLWIEDVAVLSDFRGRGIGRALLKFAMEDSPRRFGGDVFYLTSRPSRTAARRMYESMGFTQYETGVFYMKVDNT